MSVVLTVTLGAPKAMEATAPLMVIVGASDTELAKFVGLQRLNLVPAVSAVDTLWLGVDGVLGVGVLAVGVVVDELLEPPPPQATSMEQALIIAIFRMFFLKK